MLTAVCHSEADGWSEIHDLSKLSDLRTTKGNLIWAEADVANLTPSDVSLIAEEFELHPLAVEDAIHLRQRPKIEPYDRHFFTVLQQLDEMDDQLEATQIACFIGGRWVLLIHGGADRMLAEAKKRWQADGHDLQRGPAFLVHALMDAIVDDYQDIVDRLEDEVEQLEDLVLNTPTAPIQNQLYSIKQQLARVRRYALPTRRVTDLVVNDPEYFRRRIDPETANYFRDVHDHLLRMSDQTRNIDDIAQAVLDLHRSELSASLNEVTKRLTAWAAIIAVPTLIASTYGMNFVLVPEDQTIGGFWFALSLMAVTSLVLFVFFKRRGWI
jgi:magnesium transporter